ncbi:glycerophosphodiester phosphodiesterase [Alteromonas sp. C1M14]|uniref:glycerophosphodiester phosphodiesterase n=1 Tax=Alteromonas sp. C1M14 TaxID=2841567 RepID=UPI001C09B3B3|nr:glycerophosphodiester phosphodiesterase [Alteromonas sp. C1M14]MBU2978080.1 glycerophosphodiester phosphodiesterase [Alteromonas sp. C1M14]
MVLVRHFFYFIICQCVCTTSAYAFDIIAHRGAPGYLPEHTLASTTLAFTQLPDYIEQDVVISKDGVAVVLHDIHLETVTNVEEVYPERARSDGRWYVLDFTYDELKRLQVHERTDDVGNRVFSQRYQGKHGDFHIAPLSTHIELIQQLNHTFYAQVGFYVEIKSPAWHRAQGVDISATVLDVLHQHNLTAENAKLYVQCFDFMELKRLRESFHFKGKLIQLIGENHWGESTTDFDYLLTKPGLDELARYVDGIGPWLPQVIDKENNRPAALQKWVAYAKQVKLLIHPYTFRMDALPGDITAEELLTLLTEPNGVDGLFTDQVPPVKQYLSH